MTTHLDVGFSTVGDGFPVHVIAEIGINHNGDLDIAKRIISAAAEAGCSVMKFQKRTVDKVFTEEELDRPRVSPFGSTNRDLKNGLEFDSDAYYQIADHCATLGVAWTASCWDEDSVAFLERYEPPFYKIASASLTDDDLLRCHRETNRPIVLSTGMSSIAQIDHAVEILGTESLILMQCTSTYPTEPDELNLRVIESFRRRYGVPVGFSAHDRMLVTSLAAVALGACIVERHVTISRSLWGSDQASSLEPDEIARLIADIRVVEQSLGDGQKRVFESEIPVSKKLRRVI